MKDHLLCGITLFSNNNSDDGSVPGKPGLWLLKEMMKYLIFGIGKMTTSVLDGNMFYKSKINRTLKTNQPDIQFHFLNTTPNPDTSNNLNID